MLSVASLLNPVRPEARGTRLPSSPSSSFYNSSSNRGSPQPVTQPSVKKQKMTKDAPVFAKSKVKGEVNFPPFESLEPDVLREVQRFQVYPLGKIQEYSRHIPYNSEKKTFLEKTGRESFEVFQYVFKVPGDEKEYTVMWDYNIGLVRITPFFKCCKYSKTTPAKMLNMNAGLKEITHSITGGALAAQGYWMPYSCALAVCTTFCSHIAGALIPIFGPSFPSLCVPPEAPEHGRMLIDSSTVISATAEAEAFRALYSSFTNLKTSRDSYSPMHTSEPESMSNTYRRTPPNLGRRLRLKRAMGGESPYGLITDTEFDANASEASSSTGDGYFLSPTTPGSTSSSMGFQPLNTWRSLNMASHLANSSFTVAPLKSPNPLLSAIPRSAGLADMQMSGSWTAGKRALDIDDEYDGEESASASVTDDQASSVGSGKGSDALMEDVGGVEKKAAWLLMNLSVKDGECGEGKESEGPRIKRRRATSM